eukprot:3368634-Ditylum_brightwellii.AAC.2
MEASVGALGGCLLVDSEFAAGDESVAKVTCLLALLVLVTVAIVIISLSTSLVLPSLPTLFISTYKLSRH